MASSFGPLVSWSLSLCGAGCRGRHPYPCPSCPSCSCMVPSSSVDRCRWTCPPRNSRCGFSRLPRWSWRVGAGCCPQTGHGAGAILSLIWISSSCCVHSCVARSSCLDSRRGAGVRWIENGVCCGGCVSAGSGWVRVSVVGTHGAGYACGHGPGLVGGDAPVASISVSGRPGLVMWNGSAFRTSHERVCVA